MTISDKPILVTGATGQQGGAAAKHLLAQGWRVRALVRDPNKAAAQELKAKGAEIVAGDLKDRDSVDRAVRGAYGVCGVLTFMGPDGPAGETRQGLLLADAAKAAGVQHFVYSSVGGAERQSGVPHFESKWQVEEHIRKLALPVTILRPVFFMENLRSPGVAPRDGVLAMPVPASTAIQMIATDDIGAFAALAFARPEEFVGKAMEIAGDVQTMPQIADIFTRVTGQPVRYQELPLEPVRAFNADMGAMMAWFTERGFAADIAACRLLIPGLMTVEQYLRQGR